MNKRAAGAERERQASEYLERNGMKISERNFRCRQGEVDLIGWHQGYLVFVEVKYRRDGRKGYALEAVDGEKQKRICRTADFYRYSRGYGDDVGVRYDVVAIQGEEVCWIKNAFPHRSRGGGNFAF